MINNVFNQVCVCVLMQTEVMKLNEEQNDVNVKVTFIKVFCIPTHSKNPLIVRLRVLQKI